MSHHCSPLNLPSVGIILTTYNGAEFLEDQLDSLLAQEDVDVHIFAFDDKSSDRTIEILEAYSDRHEGTFSIVENDPNSGGTGINIFRNLAKVSPNHDYFALADQDDIWLPNKLSRAVEKLSEESADLYFSNLLAWDGKTEVLGTVTKNAPMEAYDHLFGGGSAGCTYVLNKHFFQHVRDVVARTDIAGVPRISHDWIIYFLARHYGFEVSASPDALIKYRIHTDSQYGGMSLGGVGAIRRKFRMLRAGFLSEQINNALLFAREGSRDREILLAYRKGLISRISVLCRFHFALTRGKSRFFALIITSLFLY